MPNHLYPPVNFFFRVYFTDSAGSGSAPSGANSWSEDVYFQSVSGLTAQLQTETIKEGGENRFEHVVPTRAKFGDLVLKRGIYPATSPLTQWVQDAILNFHFTPKDLQVQLLNEAGTPLYIWDVYHAWPKNWKIDEFNAEQGKILIETLELSYNTFKMSNA
jgi:phage tail-like protein